jgi:3-methyladenine DNA glycosylase/8-oxoguanine DNA glycosylase
VRRGPRPLRGLARILRGPMAEVTFDVTVTPPWPSEPPRSVGPGGLAVLDGGVVRRAMRMDGAVVLGEAAWRGEQVLLRGTAPTEAAARAAAERMRFVLALDDDLAPFHRAHRSDPLLGRMLRGRPKLRPLRAPEPFEALAWAVIEQLIDTQQAGGIEWALTRRHGERHPRGPWVAPLPDRLADTAVLEAAGLAPTRARTLARVARAVARGEVDPAAAPGEPGRERLAVIPGVGEWTLAHLDLFGRGVYDVPLGRDAGMRNAYARVAGVRTGSVGEAEFAAVLDRYAPWQGLAALYFVAAGWRSGGRWAESPHALRRR